MSLPVINNPENGSTTGGVTSYQTKQLFDGNPDGMYFGWLKADVSGLLTMGVKASTNGNGVVLNEANPDSSGIVRAIGVFSEIGTSVVTGIDIQAIESRMLVALDASASTGTGMKAMRGHLRVVGGKLPPAAEAAALCGYMEISGTSVIGAGGINTAVHGRVEVAGTVSGAANDVLSAFCASGTALATLSTARSTVFQIYAGSLFTSFLDIGAGCTCVATTYGSLTANLALTIYIANTAYKIRIYDNS
jgi:hypothetical protein